MCLRIVNRCILIKPIRKFGPKCCVFLHLNRSISTPEILLLLAEMARFREKIPSPQIPPVSSNLAGESTIDSWCSHYPLVNIQKAIENGHRNSGLSLIKNGGSFHSYVNVYQRVFVTLPLIGISFKRQPCLMTQSSVHPLIPMDLLTLGTPRAIIIPYFPISWWLQTPKSLRAVLAFRIW